MNANGASLLSNPHPCGHIVYPYTDEGLVGQAVSLFAAAGLRDNEGVILIMSADHCESIKVRLQIEGIDTDARERSGQLICITAEDLLAKFTPDGVLDEDAFRSTIGSLINQVRASAGHGQREKVRVFGEMVSQLRHKDLTATTRLEELWNDVIESHSVALLCTYALGGADDHVPETLVDLHSHTIERESSAAQSS
jgi:hypothetical protein